MSGREVLGARYCGPGLVILLPSGVAGQDSFGSLALVGHRRPDGVIPGRATCCLGQNRFCDRRPRVASPARANGSIVVAES
jgi:hypothetical protein